MRDKSGRMSVKKKRPRCSPALGAVHPNVCLVDKTERKASAGCVRLCHLKPTSWVSLFQRETQWQLMEVCDSGFSGTYPVDAERAWSSIGSVFWGIVLPPPWVCSRSSRSIESGSHAVRFFPPRRSSTCRWQHRHELFTL